MDKISSLEMPMSPQDISKKYKRQSLGMPKVSPSSSTKYQVISQDTIFLLLHILCVVLGASLFQFSVQFSLVCCSTWLDPSSFVLERDTLRFHCLEHSSFIPITPRVFSFCQNCIQYSFCSELFSSSLQLGVFNSLVFDEYYPCELFQIRLLVLDSRKRLYANSGTKDSLCRLCPRLFQLVMLIMLSVYCCSMTCLKQSRVHIWAY